MKPLQPAPLDRPAAGPGPADVPLCGVRPAAHTSLARQALAHGRLIACQPTSRQVANRRSTQADAAGFREVPAARRSRFDPLVTCRAIHSAQTIATRAAAPHFRTLIIGVWNPCDPGRRDAAPATARAHPRLPVGLPPGNGMLLGTAARQPDVRARLGARLPPSPQAASAGFAACGAPWRAHTPPPGPPGA